MSNPQYLPGGSTPAAPVTIIGADPTTVPLAVQAAVGQSADLLAFRNSAGAFVSGVTNAGSLVIGANRLSSVSAATGQGKFTALLDTQALIAQAVAGQTVNVAEVRTSAGTPVEWITPDGSVHSAAFGTFISGIQIGNQSVLGANFFSGTGVPAGGLGFNDGDIYFRRDTPAVANQRIYIRSAGAWVGIV